MLSLSLSLSRDGGRVGFIENTALRHRRVMDPPTPSPDDVYYYIRWRLKLEGETENMGVCTKAEGRNSHGTHGHSLHRSGNPAKKNGELQLLG